MIDWSATQPPSFSKRTPRYKRPTRNAGANETATRFFKKYCTSSSSPPCFLFFVLFCNTHYMFSSSPSKRLRPQPSRHRKDVCTHTQAPTAAEAKTFRVCGFLTGHFYRLDIRFHGKVPTLPQEPSSAAKISPTKSETRKLTRLRAFEVYAYKIPRARTQCAHHQTRTTWSSDVPARQDSLS